MATPVFDPSLPVDHSDIIAGELRGQFVSPDDHCNALDSNVESRALKPTGVDPLTTPISNPPTQAQVTELRDKVNELLAALQA